jgi:hypothetical protein
LTKIIISYRRSDSDVFAGRVRDRIAGRYGENSVFIDVDNIPFGKDFRVHIQEVLAEADAVLVVIGPRWLGAGKAGTSRIKDNTDPVRIEVETALSNKTPTIPILVGKTNMPKPEQLPESLRDFAFINAAPVDTGRDFHRDLNRVLATIDPIVGQPLDAAKMADAALELETNDQPAVAAPARADDQEATAATSDSNASNPRPILKAAAVEPQASDETASRSDKNADTSRATAVNAPLAFRVAGQRPTWMPSAAMAVGGFLVVGATLWFLLMRSEPGRTISAAPAPDTASITNRETAAPPPVVLTPQPTPVGPAASVSTADSDPGAKVVRDFYAALSRGDGAAAAELVVPERRNGNYDPKGMTDFFSKNYQRLQLAEVATAGQNTYHVTYTFKKSEKSSDCPFSGTVSVTQRGGQYLILNTNIHPGC